MKRSILLAVSLVALSLIIGASLFVYRWSRHDKDFTVIRMAQCGPSLYKIPHYIAREKALYGKQKLKIREIAFNSDREALDALEKGMVDIALVSPASLIIKSASNLKEEPLAAAFASLDRGTTYHLVATENKPLGDFSALKNKTIITGPPDSEETVFIEQTLRNKGLKPYEDMTLITSIPLDVRIGALKSGTGNYLLIEDKNLPEALTRGLFRVMSLKAGFPAYVCVALKDFIKQNPQTLQSFTNALYMAQIWAGYHTPGETAAALEKTREMKGPSLAGQVESCYRNESLAASPALAKEDMEALIKMLDRSREIPMPVKASDLISGDFAGNALITVKYVPEDKEERTGLRRLKFW